MTRWTPAPFVGGAYSDDSKEWSAQDTVNYIVVNAERQGTRSAAKLRGVPGMVVYSDLGTNSPIRGAHNCEGLLLVVSGNTLFKVQPNGVPVAVGNIPGASRVSMAHNQYEGGYQVAIANGTGGYVYNTLDDSLVQITDEGFPGAISFDYVDSYITGIEPGKRFAFTSQLADATDYNTLDRQEAEGSPDLLVGQLVTHREWWLFSKRSIEPYVNTGANTGTFQRAYGVFIERGAASTHCMVALDNAPFWVGDDGIVYRAYGYTPQRISTVAIEHALAQCDLSRCFAFTFEDQGHKVYYLTCPDGHTWGYDVQTQEWHRRQSYGLNRWRVSTLTKWNGYWVAGDYQNGKLYVLDWNTQAEADQALERRRITGVMSDTENALIVNAVRLVVDTGQKSPPIAVSPQYGALKIFGNFNGGAIGIPYYSALTISGGDGNYSLTGTGLISGTLPPSLSLSVSGDHLILSGTPTGSASTYPFTVGVTSGDGQSATSPQRVPISSNVMQNLWDPMTMPVALDFLTNSNATYNNSDAVHAGAHPMIFSIAPIIGKRYFEYQIDCQVGTTTGGMAGVAPANTDRLTNTVGRASDAGVAESSVTQGVWAYSAMLGNIDTAAQTVSMRVRIAVDSATRNVWIGAVNSSGWVLGGDPVAGTTPTYTIAGTAELMAAASLYGNNSTVTIIHDSADLLGAVPAGYTAGIDVPAVPRVATVLDQNVSSGNYNFTNGNLTAVGTSALNYLFTVLSTNIKTSGMPYWEVTAINGSGATGRSYWGVSRLGGNYAKYQPTDPKDGAASSQYSCIRGDGTGYTNSVPTAGLTGVIKTGDIIRNRFNIGTGLYEIAINGGDWVTLASGLSSYGWRACMSTYYGAYTAQGGSYNFGATPFAYPVSDGYDAGWLP